MFIDDIAYKLKEVVGDENVRRSEPMKKHTSFRAGGPADLLVHVKSVQDLKGILKILNREGIRPHCMGNGSNLLVRDKGIRGVVLKISNGFDFVSIKGCRVVAGAGVLLSKLSSLVANESLSGFEFASGIPGTLGGAIAMNAGAYGGEMKDVVRTVRGLDIEGTEVEYGVEQMEFGYRKSIVQEKEIIITEVEMEFEKGDRDEIRAVIEDYSHRRSSKQPLNLPSAGSTFKRPEGHYAGKLIEDAGLKGISIGGARVSEKHCGFIVSDGTASADEIISLIEKVQKAVKERFGVVLEREVKIMGEG